ncbi:hypothetical protein Q5752_000616 [Cryptotrichosporon argae]
MPDDLDAVLTLPEWLKLLASRGVEMRTAMALAAKVYKTHSTRALLGSLSGQKLATLVDDKDKRKAVANALRGLSTGQAVNKKRERDADLLRPLQPEKVTGPSTYEFDEVVDPEQLIPVTVTVNRAPVKTAWAYAVARRLGFSAAEALSLAHVHVHIASMKHALSVGGILNAQEEREAREELEELGENVRGKVKVEQDKSRRGWREEKVVLAVGSSQPWVSLLRSKPIIERPDGELRAIQRGEAADPSLAHAYITRALRGDAGAVLGAMRLVAESYDAEELNNLGSSMYNEFKPDVVEWGQRGTLSVAKILDQIKVPIDATGEAAKLDPGAELPVAAPTDVKLEHFAREMDEPAKPEIPVKRELDDMADEADKDEPAPKRARDMTVEEYEAMLDAEGEGGFMDAGDLADVP